MRKTLLLSALLLPLASGIAWSAPNSCDAQALAELDVLNGAVETAKPGSGGGGTTPTPCTISCPVDPISCSSQVGDCRYSDIKGFISIVCDGQWYSCPSGF